MSRRLAVLALLTAALLPLHVAAPGASSLDSAHPANACSKPFHVSGAGWDLCWQQDDLRVQGLEVNRVFFHDRSVAWKMGVPFSLTQYRGLVAGTFKDTLGTPDAAGVPGSGNGTLDLDPGSCPRFFGQGEIVNDGRVCVEHREGVQSAVSLWARYDIVNYRFLQGWTFHERGVVEPFVALGGQLLDGSDTGAEGTNHFHHVYWRLDLDIASPGNDTAQAFTYPPAGPGAARTGVDYGPADCRAEGAPAVESWCSIPREGAFTSHEASTDRWRVVDEQDTNSQDHRRSFAFRVRSDAEPNGFSSFDTITIDRKGDSEEIGHEVSPSAHAGDHEVREYATPPEEIEDPVVWVVSHVYHDTRDEERGSMPHHYVSFELEPRNFLDENPGESTFP